MFVLCAARLTDERSQPGRLSPDEIIPLGVGAFPLHVFVEWNCQ
jgi:hypothetical protein